MKKSGKSPVSGKSHVKGNTSNDSVILICVIAFALIIFVGLLALLIGIFVGMAITENDELEPLRVVLNPEQPKPTPTPIPTVPVGLPPRVNVDIGDSPFLGDEDAPVTIIEFSDFECPFCARWYIDTKSQIDEQYIKMGKVKLVYMHYPLSFHPQAEPAALASECAYEQGKFWEFHDLIFENQRVISDANYKKWAADLGLDQAQFDDCYDSKKYQADVQDDFNKGQRAGVRGTPGFFVNGRLVSGAQPFSVFQQAIEAELNR